ncbi:hypothetical protein GPECTOR_1052g328 [Gonium pectorale]|uniref:URB1 C-terminal domain-containing protein n=1 Tax=Gonium pectorale TaxID=33097 RepID=A0A150FTP9_GONPE|nr:hypothetical protein GPECTOR_1052g328 [Gonium pectorale]|eukprot:KXZ40984.1 hypothetical protein GPECTOR_1052g328 [Gonium pectorale]
MCVPGGPLSLDSEDDDGSDGGASSSGRPPVATSAEQLALAEALLRGALGRTCPQGFAGAGASTEGAGRGGGGGSGGGVSSAEDMAAVGALLGAAASTLAALYGQGVLPGGGGSPGQRRLLAAASACLDGCLGDLLADAPDSLRAGPAFAAVDRIVAEHHPPDARALGLAYVRFPAGRTLAADEDDPWVGSGATAAAYAATPAEDTDQRKGPGGAGADPAWLLPFAVCCLRHGGAAAQELLGWGVLPLCLRCLASDDVPLRTLAYEAVALATAQLDQLAASAAAAHKGPAAAGPAAVGPALRGGSAHSATDAAQAGPHRAASDFRQRPQLQALLAHVRNAVGSPLQQFPHLAALAAAEAAVVLSQPQAPMHKPITRLVGRKPALDLASPALFNRVLAAGAPGQRHEQTWALQLLRYGVMVSMAPGSLPVFERRLNRTDQQLGPRA